MARTPRLRPGSAWPGPATRRCKTCSPESMTRRSPRLSGACGTWSDAGRRYRLAASSRWSGRWHVISSPGRQETRGRPVTRTSPTPNIPLWARYGSRTGSGIGDHRRVGARLSRVPRTVGDLGYGRQTSGSAVYSRSDAVGASAPLLPLCTRDANVRSCLGRCGRSTVTGCEITLRSVAGQVVTARLRRSRPKSLYPRTMRALRGGCAPVRRSRPSPARRASSPPWGSTS